MQRHLLRVSLVLLTGTAALLAADFWEKKAPPDWTAEEVETILTDSPWAQTGAIAFIGDRGQPIGGGSGGGIGFPRSPFPTSGPTNRTGQPDGGWGGRFSNVGTERRAFPRRRCRRALEQRLADPPGPRTSRRGGQRSAA